MAFYSNDPSLGFAEHTYLGAHRSTVNKVMRGTSNSYTGFTPAQANLLPAAGKKVSNVVPDIALYGCTPICYEPVVRRTATTSEGVTVVWYYENAAVQIAIKESDADNWDPAVTVGGDGTSTSSYTFDHLLPMTAYDLRLRRVCDVTNSDYSDWVVLHLDRKSVV